MLAIIPLYILCIIAITNPNNSFPHRIFTAPQNPFEMLTNSETQLASAYYNVRIGGDMALLKGMMRLLIERDDAASAAGRPSLLDDEFIQTHTVGFDELRRDVLNSEWKDGLLFPFF